MQLTGFKPPIGGITPLQNEYGISANISWDSKGIMNYQAIIPFNTFCKNALSESGSKRIFSVSIYTTSSNSSKFQPQWRIWKSLWWNGRWNGWWKNGRRYAGWESFGGEGRRGGGGPRNFEGTGGQNTLNEPTRIKMKIKLLLIPNKIQGSNNNLPVIMLLLEQLIIINGLCE